MSGSLSRQGWRRIATGRGDWVWRLALVALVLAVFWRAFTGGVFYFGDIYQLHYPLRTAYSAALREFSLPLWSPAVMGGYPLLAEGQLGALYPPNLLLHALLPVPLALNVTILGHLILAAWACYAYARHLGLQHNAAFAAGAVYALGGFMVAHLNHVNIICCGAWLPLLFLWTDRLLTDESPRASLRNAVLLAFAVGMELLAGHPQIALLSLVATLAYAMFLVWAARPKLKQPLYLALAVLLGVAIAAAQLLPTIELTQQSVRAEGLEPEFFASFSLHPLYLISLLWPFVAGNPYPEASVELVGYVGALPLLLAGLAALWTVRRQSAPSDSTGRCRFFVLLAAAALLLSLGRWNPVYMVLARLPLLNLFRVPARYLYWFSFSAALLAGAGLDLLLHRRQTAVEDKRSDSLFWPMGAGVTIAAIWLTSRFTDVQVWLTAWRWLPMLLLALGAAWAAWVWRRPADPMAKTGVALLIIVGDLIAFNAVFGLTYNQTMPQAEFVAPPRTLSIVRAETEPQRILTHEEIVPVLPVMRETLYPNLSILHDVAALNGAFPLVLKRYASFTEVLTPQMVNLMGVKHFIIPQVLPVDEESEWYDLENPYALNPVGEAVDLQPVDTVALGIESYLSHSVSWASGQPVAEIQLADAEGGTVTFTLRAGWHTSEWAYERSDVIGEVKHDRAAVVRSWPARSGFPPEDHLGHTYGTSLRLDTPMKVVSVRVEPLVPAAFLRIERLVLVDPDGGRHLLTHLAGLSDQTLAYRSEDAAIYVNHDAQTRAFVVHETREVSDDEEALRLMRENAVDLRSTVLLARSDHREQVGSAAGEESAEITLYAAQQVHVSVEATTPGYLLLTDTWYPGWEAYLDGQRVELHRANVLLRAVFVPVGRHKVEFVYRPESFRRGLGISALATLLVAVLALTGWALDRRSPHTV